MSLRGVNQRKTNRTKSEIISEYEAKGAAWLAEKLYQERQKVIEIKANCGETRRYSNCVDYDLEKQVNNASRVLSENGIKPIRVIVEYVANRCQDCPVDECYDWEYCEEEGKRHVSTCSFWCFDISEDGVYGILTDFKEFDHEVISVKTMDGKELWKEAVK